jgi:hypothetical protein
MAATLCASPDASDGTDKTAAAVAALEAKLGNPAGLEIDEVRVTDSGVVCIDYSMRNAEGVKTPGHAVVQGDEVLQASSGDRFENLWNKHCLGPRGGTTSG